MNVLLIGRGSIGAKHHATLEELADALKLTIHIFTPSNHGVGYYHELTGELVHHAINAAFICNPTIMHEDTAIACLNAGANVFLEKPLGATWNPKSTARMANILSRKSLTLMTGYDMRFNPYIEKIKALLEKETIGLVWGARVVAGQYLPDWRPGTDYRKNYGAKKALGGGVLLDLSHELDYLHWLLPKRVKRVSALNLQTGQLAIETEDIASITLEYSDKSTAHVHLDYLNVPYRRSLELYGEKGTIIWDDNAHTLRLYTIKARKWQNIQISSKSASATAIFKKELRHFFNCIVQGETPRNSLANAEYVMRLIERARQSSGNRAAVAF